MIERFKNKDSDFSVKDHQARTILHHAVMGRNPGVVERNLDDEDTRRLNIGDIDGWTPLHWACRSESNKELVRLLMYGKDSQLLTHDEWTPQSISIFHDAKTLLPIMHPASAGSNRTHTTDTPGTNEASALTVHWRTGLSH